MQINGVTKDALELCRYIDDSLPYGRNWAMVNIAKSKNRNFIFTSEIYKEIPTSFGYSWELVPELLEKNGVILAKKSKSWFLKISENDSKKDQKEPLFLIGEKAGYFTQDVKLDFYYRWTREYFDHGPTLAGQYSILVDTSKLKQFIGYYSGFSPFYNEIEGVFYFMNQRILFRGETDKNGINILVKNINSMISRKDLYESNGDTNYEIKKKKEELTQLHDTIDKRFSKIKETILENKVLAKCLVFAKQDGFYGLFVNQSNLIKIQS